MRRARKRWAGFRVVVPAALSLCVGLPCGAGGRACVGDCDGNGEVAINELITGVGISLGTRNPDDCPAFDADGDGNVAINELITGVNSALLGCGAIPSTPTATATPGPETPTPTPGAALGERVFTIREDSQPTQESRSALVSSALASVFEFPNVAGGFSSGPLRLRAGSPDADGVAPLELAEDALFGITALDGSVLCVKLLAEGSSGRVDCDGGPAPDVVLSQEEGADAGPATLEIREGDRVAPGAAVLRVQLALGQLPAGSALDDCAGAAFDPPSETAFTTAVATAIKGRRQMQLAGENFDCSDWGDNSGPGMLAAPLVGFDPRAGGDAANILRVADN